MPRRSPSNGAGGAARRRAVALAACAVLGGCATHGPTPDGSAPSGSAAVSEPASPAPSEPEAPGPDVRLPGDGGPGGADPAARPAGAEQGLVSWYGARFAGRRTACGTRFDPKGMTMAHPSLPCGTRVRVTNPANGHEVVLVVTDRGPFTGGRIADVSRAAARALGITASGDAMLDLEVLGKLP